MRLFSVHSGNAVQFQTFSSVRGNFAGHAEVQLSVRADYVGAISVSRIRMHPFVSVDSNPSVRVATLAQNAPRRLAEEERACLTIP